MREVRSSRLMFSNARNMLFSYAIFWFSWTQRKSRINVGKDDNGLEYIEFVEGHQKQGKEDCPKRLEIFCPLCHMKQEMKDAQLPFFNEYLPRQPEALQMSKNNTWNKSQSIWARKLYCTVLYCTVYKHGNKKR